MEWFSMLKLDLEAVVEDVSDEVHIFEIQISLIYSKFVGIVGSSSYHTISTLTFYHNPSLRRIILRNPIVLNLCLSASSEAFFAIFNSGYTS